MSLKKSNWVKALFMLRSDPTQEMIHHDTTPTPLSQYGGSPNPDPREERITFRTFGGIDPMLQFFVAHGYTVDKTPCNESGMIKVSIHRTR